LRLGHEEDDRANLRQCLGHGDTEAARRTGDKRHSVVEVTHCSGPSFAPDQRRAEAIGISLRNRRLGNYRLSYLEALEFGMLQIEWPGRIVAGARVRSAAALTYVAAHTNRPATKVGL
jgi:hypothetical protein